MIEQRIAQLLQRAAQHQLSAIAVMPGPNMQYFTGLHFHLSERPAVALFPVNGQPALICPAFEATKTQRSPIAWQLFTYVDGQNPLEAFQAACGALQLDRSRLGVEAYKMRVLELRLFEQAANITSVPADDVIASLRMIKDADEIAQLRHAVAITEQALDEVLPLVRAGMTERTVANELLQALLRAGAEGLAFDPLIQSGPNTALPHVSASERVIEGGELLLLDFGITLNGYNSDITRTFAVGQAPSAEFQKIYEIVKQANAAARAIARPGVSGQDIDRAARQVIVDAGYGAYFTHRTGHGLGLEGHEPPYMVEGNAVPLEVGNTFTIEPGIYIPGFGGVRIEDDMVITAQGAESLTTYDRELRVIGK